MVDVTDPEWIDDCLKRRGKVLRGIYSHWCGDRAGWPVDETTAGWPCMHTEQLIDQLTKKRNFERMTSFFIQIDLQRFDTDLLKRFLAAIKKDPVLTAFIATITTTDQDGKAAFMPWRLREDEAKKLTPLKPAAPPAEQVKAAEPKPKSKPKKKTKRKAKAKSA